MTELVGGRQALAHVLLEELSQRQLRNSSYSLRAFSRDLGVNVTSLSQYLSGKRQLSAQHVRRIAECLDLPPTILSALCSKAKDVPLPVLLEEDAFYEISDWYYYGILNLARLKKNRAAPEWIAKRLGITSVMARSALGKLENLGLVKQVGGRLIRTSRNLTSGRNAPSAALRRYHKQNLELAATALDSEPLSRRFITSIVMPTDPRQLDAAKDLILQFRDSLSELLETGSRTEVYTLAIQLFPLTKTEVSQ